MTDQQDNFGPQWEQRKWRRRTRIVWVLATVLILLIVAVYVPTPYYITRPGSAISLMPIVEVEGGSRDEKGSFMLTTVRMGEANLLWYLYAKLSPEADLLERKQVVLDGESNQDFAQRELAVMKSSQQTAEAVAFQQAGYDVKVENVGVQVMATIPDLPARKIFRIGDVITAIDGEKITRTKEMLEYLSNKKEGQKVEVTFLRKNKEMKETLALAPLPDENGRKSKRVGLGISPDNKLIIEIPKKVTIHAENIGGPSAGLMFTLEIYDQLNKQLDLTRGYKIAGTGTIHSDGTVGRIGGINHKVVAADRAGAEIFFAPNDETLGLPSNYEEAAATAKRIGTSMRIVPVNNVADAIKYLKALSPKRA